MDEKVLQKKRNDNDVYVVSKTGSDVMSANFF